MPFQRSLVASLLLSGLLAQDPVVARVQPYPIDLPDEYADAVVNGTRTKEGRPGPAHWTDHARYDLAIELDPVTARVTGKAKLVYENRSPAPLTQLVLHLYQNLMRADAERTRTVVPTSGFELGQVKVRGAVVRATPRDTRLTLRLAEPVAPGSSVDVEIDWAYTVPVAGTAPRTGHEKEDVYYLGYWYPQFAVRDDVLGWVADRYRGNGEFYMPYGDYDLSITAPQGYIVRATGVLQNPKDVLTDDAIAALAQAASSREVVHVVDAEDLEKGTQTKQHESGKLTWRFRAENVRDAAVSVARTYLWDATHAVVARGADGSTRTCEIHAVYEQNSGDWVRAAEYARHTIEWMSEQVYPYPWPHMTACEGIIGGGMEYPMMTICGGRRPQSVITHELTHMWFPMLLGSNEKRYAWQDEGFTTYWSSLCLAAGNNRRIGSRGDVASAAAQIARGGDVVCMRHGDGYVDDDFGFASYGKPAAVLAQLRGLIGDEAFLNGFRRYAQDWAFKHPYPYDFFQTMQDVSGVDLQSYFRTWLFEAWQLDHAVGRVEAGDASTTVEVVDRGRAQLQCVVEATLADGSKVRAVVPTSHWKDHNRATVTFAGRATEVQLDPDVTTIDVDRDNNRWRTEAK